jgi:hypothetical protein
MVTFRFTLAAYPVSHCAGLSERTETLRARHWHSGPPACRCDLRIAIWKLRARLEARALRAYAAVTTTDAAIFTALLLR